MSGWILSGHLYFVPVILIVASLRGLPGFFRTERYAADEAFHIYLTDEIRQNGHRIPDEYDQLLPPTAVHYPVFVHWLMSFLPHRIVVALSSYFAVIIDGLHALVVMALAAWFFSAYASGIPVGPATILAGLIFVLTPKLVTGRPLTARLQLGGRAPGALLFTCSAGGYIGWALTGRTLFVFIAVTGVGLVALTSSFSAQTLALFYVGFSVVSLDVMPFAILIGGGVLAYLLSRGRYSGTFRAHTGTLLFYFRHLELERAARFKDRISKLYHIKDVLRDPPQLTRNTFGNHLRSASIGFFRYVYTHHVIGAYLQLPFLIFIPILLAFGNIGKSWMHILIWILILLVANAVIAIPGIPGNPAHRYTEYLVAPLSILVTYGYFTTSIVFEFPFYQLMSVSDSLLLLLTIYSLGAIVTNSIIDGKISPPADLSHAVDFLKEIDRQCHVYAIPGTYGKRVLPDTNHAQMQAIHDHFATRDGRRECFELFVSSDEKDRLEKAHNRYTVDYILGDIELIEDEIDGEFNPLFSSGDVGVYTLESIMTED